MHVVYVLVIKDNIRQPDVLRRNHQLTHAAILFRIPRQLGVQPLLQSSHQKYLNICVYSKRASIKRDGKSISPIRREMSKAINNSILDVPVLFKRAKVDTQGQVHRT